jgi:hypothetical protein
VKGGQGDGAMTMSMPSPRHLVAPHRSIAL